MTANELKYNFLLSYDKLFEYGAPAYDDKQVSDILTKAQMRVFKRFYHPFKNRYKEGFERSEYKSRGLSEFLRTAHLGGEISVSSNQEDAHTNGTLYDLPENYLFAVSESATVDNKEVLVRSVTHDSLTINDHNPYKKPYSEVIWRLDYSREDHGEDGGDSFTGKTPKRLELIVEDKVTKPVTAYSVRYVCMPPPIVCDTYTPANQRHSILDPIFHDEIVDEAVKIAMASTSPETYQVGYTEQKDNES